MVVGSRAISIVQLVAYGQSKTANIWMANEIERQFGSQGLHGLAVHPGIIKTNIMNGLSGEDRHGIFEAERMQPLIKSVPQGAATQVWAAIGRELEGVGGVYLADCEVKGSAAQLSAGGLSQCAAHAFDEAGAKRLWQESCRMVGVACPE